MAKYKPKERAESLVIAENLNIAVAEAENLDSCSPEYVARLNVLEKRSTEYRVEGKISKVNHERLIKRINQRIHRCFGNL